MDEGLVLKNRLKEARADRGLSQAELAKLVGVSRNTRAKTSSLFIGLPPTFSAKFSWYLQDIIAK